MGGTSEVAGMEARRHKKNTSHLRLLVALCSRLAVSVGVGVASFGLEALDVLLHVLGHLGHYPAGRPNRPSALSRSPPENAASPGGRPLGPRLGAAWLRSVA